MSLSQGHNCHLKPSILLEIVESMQAGGEGGGELSHSNVVFQERNANAFASFFAALGKGAQFN